MGITNQRERLLAISTQGTYLIFFFVDDFLSHILRYAFHA